MKFESPNGNNYTLIMDNGRYAFAGDDGVQEISEAVAVIIFGRDAIESAQRCIIARQQGFNEGIEAAAQVMRRQGFLSSTEEILGLLK